jgi:hypothetical protein
MSPASFQKRQKERDRQQRKEAKAEKRRQRRDARAQGTPTDPANQEASPQLDAAIKSEAAADVATPQPAEDEQTP